MQLRIVRHVSQKSSRNFICFSGVQPQRKYVKKLKSVDPKGEAQALLPLGGLCAGSEALQLAFSLYFTKCENSTGFGKLSTSR